jgi:hypothetical protein
MLASVTYSQETEQMISITGGITYPIGGDDLQYWKAGYNIGASYGFFVSSPFWLGVQIDLSRFGFNQKKYFNDWNKWWNISLPKTHIAGNGRTFYSIGGSLNMMLVENSKIKLFILGGMGLFILSSSIITVNGEAKSFYSAYGNLGIHTGACISFELKPRTSFVIETKYQKFIWPMNLELTHSASTVAIKTGMMFNL